MTRRAGRITGSRVRFGVASALVAMVAAACTKKPAAITAKEIALPDSAEQQLFGVSIVLTDNGVSKGRLLADTAFRYPDAAGARLELRRVRIVFFTPQGAEDGTLVAREGTYSERLNRLEGRGNVIVVRNDGNRLESPQLVFDNARNQIFSDSSFVLTRPNKQVTSGIGFESDPKLTNFKVMRNLKVSAPVQVPR